MILKVYSKDFLTETVHVRSSLEDKRILKQLGHGKISTGFQILMDLFREDAIKWLRKNKKNENLTNLKEKAIKKSKRKK